MTNQHLSETVQALIQKAQIVSFATWSDTHPVGAIERFQAADDGRRYLTDEDLQQLSAIAPDTTALLPVARLLRDQATEIVEEARSQLLSTFPGITQPGGDLYPPERAIACWRDFWQFLRCITYGIAGHRTDYTSPVGLHYMQLLYQELRVPLAAMVAGLENVKAASLQRVMPTQQTTVAPYFDHLIDQLRQFHA